MRSANLLYKFKTLNGRLKAEEHKDMPDLVRVQEQVETTSRRVSFREAT